MPKMCKDLLPLYSFVVYIFFYSYYAAIAVVNIPIMITKVANVTFMEDKKSAGRRFWLVNLKERDRLEDLVVNGRITLKYISGKYNRKAWTRCIQLRIGARNGML
jgi:hypothetical protein